MSKLRALIARHESEMSDLRAAEADLLGKIDAIRNKLTLLDATLSGIMQAQEAMEPSYARKTVSKVVPVLRKRRALQEHWQRILQHVGGDGQSFSYENLHDAARTAWRDVGRDNLRSQMSLYKSAGLVKSVGHGEFRLTNEGREAAGMKRDEALKENEAPSGDAVGASDAEEVDASSVENRSGFRLVG